MNQEGFEPWISSLNWAISVSGDWSWNNIKGHSPTSLIKGGQLSVTGGSICTSTGLLLGRLSLPRERVSRLTHRLNMILILVLLNKLRRHAYFLFSANQITWSKLFIQIQILNNKQCRSRSVGFFRSQLIWIYTVCKDRVYPGSAGQGLINSNDLAVKTPNQTVFTAYRTVLPRCL